MATWLQSSIFRECQYRCLVSSDISVWEESWESKSTSAVLGVGSSQPASIRAVCMRSRGWDRGCAALGLSTTLSLSGEAAARASPRRLKLQVRLSLVLYRPSCVFFLLVLRHNFVLFECRLCFFGFECFVRHIIGAVLWFCAFSSECGFGDVIGAVLRMRIYFSFDGSSLLLHAL